MKRRFDLYLKDVLNAIENVKEYIGDLDVEDVLKDRLRTDAILRNLEIIGEAVSQLPKEIKEKYKEIPWRDIKDFRNVVAHRYWKINLARIVDIIENKLDSLKQKVENILIKEKDA